MRDQSNPVPDDDVSDGITCASAGDLVGHVIDRLNEPRRQFNTGVRLLDKNLIIAPGTLTVLSACNMQGETPVIDIVMAHCLESNFPVCLVALDTFEEHAYERLNVLREAIASDALYNFRQRIGSEATLAAAELMRERLATVFLSLNENQDRSLRDTLDRAAEASRRVGAKLLVIDPFDDVDIGGALDDPKVLSGAIAELKKFAEWTGLAVWVVDFPDRQHWSPFQTHIYAQSQIDTGLIDFAVVQYHREDGDDDLTVAAAGSVPGCPARRTQFRLQFDRSIFAYREVSVDAA